MTSPHRLFHLFLFPSSFRWVNFYSDQYEMSMVTIDFIIHYSLFIIHYSHRHRRFNSRMRLVIEQLKIFVSEIKNIFLRWIDLHNRQWKRRSAQLLVSLFKMVIVQVNVTKRMNEF